FEQRKIAFRRDPANRSIQSPQQWRGPDDVAGRSKLNNQHAHRRMKALALASAKLSLTRATPRLQPPKAILLCLDQTPRRRVIGHNSAAKSMRILDVHLKIRLS